MDRIMRVALINPQKLFNPFETYLTIGTPSFCPGGRWVDPPLLIIGAGLKQKGCDVKLFDGDNSYPLWSFEELVNRVVEFGPDVVVIPTETVDYYRTPLSSYENINLIIDGIANRMSERPTVIVYGPHLIVDRKDLSSNVGFVIPGEGEEAVVETILSGGKKSLGTQYVEDLDSLPLPDYSLVEGEDLECSDFASDVKGKFTQIVSSRGCPHKCAFCVRYGLGNKLRLRSSSNVMKEVVMLKELGYESFYMIDDVWGLNKKWALDICDGLKKLDMKWTCQTQSRILSDPMLVDRMKEAGCTSVGVGVETYNEDLLRRVGKPSSIEEIDKAVKNCKVFGIKFICFIVLGLPGEKEEHVRRTSQWIMENNFYGSGAFLATPYPGTPLGEEMGVVDVGEALYRAGLACGYLFDHVEARRFWRKWDIVWGKPSIQETIRRYRPDIWWNYQEGILQEEGAV